MQGQTSQLRRFGPTSTSSLFLLLLSRRAAHPRIFSLHFSVLPVIFTMGGHLDPKSGV
jgi:hypothetical protein